MLFSPFFDFVNKKPNHKWFIFMQQLNISSSNFKKKMLSSYGIFIKSWFLLFTFCVYRHSPIRREIQFAANVVHSICYRSCVRIDRARNNCYTNWKIKKKESREMVQRKKANRLNLDRLIFVVSIALISLAILFKYPKQFVYRIKSNQRTTLSYR